MKRNTVSFFIMAAVTLLSAGCATHLNKAASFPAPASVKLSTFTQVEAKAVGISEAFASNSANQKALKKIDELIFRDIRMIFPNLKRIEAGQEFSAASEKTLQMTFTVKEAPPAVKGDTAKGGNKQITLENGTVINAPLFIEAGEKIIVNTETGEYAERA
jgi:hypothetical protein